MAVIIHVFIICQWCSNHNQTGVLLHPPVQVQTRGGQVPAWERGSSSVYSPSLHLRHPQHWEWDFSVRVERELLQYIQPAEGQVLEEAVSDKGLHWVFPTLTVRCFFVYLLTETTTWRPCCQSERGPTSHSQLAPCCGPLHLMTTDEVVTVLCCYYFKMKLTLAVKKK